MMTNRTWFALSAPAGILLVSAAHAQQVDDGLIVQPAVPQDFNRGSNVSVSEVARPDYAPLGLRIGGLRLSPSVELGAGGTTNTYLSPENGVASPFLSQQASARLTSLWSRHSLQMSASATKREYLGQSQRNEDVWSASASGRLDIHSDFRVDASASAAKAFENLFSGEISPTVAALSRYRRDTASVRGTYTQGRTRAFVAFDIADFRFLPVPLRNGGEQDQSARNRTIKRGALQFEYARSPSVAFFAQLSGTRIKYNRTTADRNDRASKSVRMLGGVNVDIAGRIRGTIGLGYVIRDYDAAVFKTLRGFSGEVQIEVFPTQRLTLEIDAQRSIQDIRVGALRPTFNNRLTLSADYELLRNLIISGGATIQRQRQGDTYRANASGRYLISRRFALQGGLSYTQRTSSSVSDARVDTGLVFRL